MENSNVEIENKKNKKVFAIVLAALILMAVVAVFIFILSGGKEESYRLIKVYELSGEAVVTRAEIGEIEVYNNMVLNSGDTLYMKSGTMTLKLDDDKYVYVEENTKFEILATGNTKEGKTTINLQQGAITNELQKKLTGASSYEVNTPNSNMAVRGTFFRVEIYEKDGVLYTKVSVFDGEVATKLRYRDGTYSEEQVFVAGGKEVIIFEDDVTTDYLMGVTEIAYADLPKQVKQLIEEILGPITEQDNRVPEGESDSAEDTEEEDAGESDFGEDTEKENTGEPDSGENTDNEDADDNQEDTDSTSDTANNTGQNSSAAVSYTVTFQYQGATFGTQTVTSGSCASKPVLMPAKSGAWDFDFTTPITGNTVIEWR